MRKSIAGEGLGNNTFMFPDREWITVLSGVDIICYFKIQNMHLVHGVVMGIIKVLTRTFLISTGYTIRFKLA